jgi:hypothetical protein
MQQLIQDMNQQLGTFVSFEHMEQVRVTLVQRSRCTLQMYTVVSAA